jgi:hypothetical protein
VRRTLIKVVSSAVSGAAGLACCATRSLGALSCSGGRCRSQLRGVRRRCVQAGSAKTLLACRANLPDGSMCLQSNCLLLPLDFPHVLAVSNLPKATAASYNMHLANLYVLTAGRAVMKGLAAELAGRATAALALSTAGADGLAAALSADLPAFAPTSKPVSGAEVCADRPAECPGTHALHLSCS